MKKVIMGLVLVGVLGSAVPAFAQVATSTPSVEGHRQPHIASTIDSTSNRGSWYISNVFPDFGRLVYVSEAPREFSNWRTYFLAMNYR
jgi:hypothetical protein